MLSYFGTDQSQVQRYLSGKSVKQSQLGLMFNGLLKVPMQFFILLVGVMVFVFYQYNSAPLHFNPTNVGKVMDSDFAHYYKDIQNRQDKNTAELIALQQEMMVKDAPLEDQQLLDKMQSLQQKDREYRGMAKMVINIVDDNATINDKDYVLKKS